MTKIVVKRKAEVYKEFPISQSQTKIIVGSDGDNDLIISDQKASLRHFSIEQEGGHFYITDLDSAFGTNLNGRKITGKVRLIHGDDIVIGDHSLKFEHVPKNPDKQSQQNKQTEKKENIVVTEANRSEPKKIADKKKQPSSKQKKPVPHYLLAIYGPLTGKKFQLNFDTTKIGRDQTLNDIIIRETASGEIDTSISRRHATILFENDRYYVTDKRSKTRTRVNQHQLTEDDKVELKPADEIEIISDRKSTIFRFLPEGDRDKSRPKKAGYWWMRNASRMRKTFSVIVSLLLVVLISNCLRTYNLLTQQPDSLDLIEKNFYTTDDNHQIYLSLNEAKSNMSMLSPATADLDGDNFLDILFSDKIGYLRVINGKSKTTLWNSNHSFRLQSGTSFTIADINGDQRKDIVFMANNSVLYALDGTSGNEIWTSPILGGEFSGSPVVSDFNGDQITDVCMATTSGQIHIGWGTFTSPDWTIFENESAIKSPLSTGDFDDDDLQELVFASETGRVVIFDPQEMEVQHVINVNEEIQKAKGSFFEDHLIQRRISIGDLNGDKSNDLLIVTEKNCLLAFDIKKNKRLWFDQVVTSIDSFTVAPPNLADLTGDQIPDVVYVTPDNKIVVYDGKGSGGNSKKIVWGHIPENERQYISPPVLIDIDKDQINDVIVSDFYGRLDIFNGANGKILTEQIQFSQDSSAFIGAPLAGDFNNNGLLDILIRKNDDSFSIFETPSKIFKSSVLWSQYNFHSSQNDQQNLLARPRQVYFVIVGIVAAVFVFLILLFNLVIDIKRRSLFAIK